MAEAWPFSSVNGRSTALNIYCEPPEFLSPAERRAFEPLAFFGSLPSIEYIEEMLPRPATPNFRPDSQGHRVYISFGTVVRRYYEREALAAYVASGGRALVLLEPEEVPELSADLERFGVKVSRDIVLDANPASQLMGLDESFLVLSEDSWSFHPITDKLHAIVILGITRSVAKGEVTDGFDVRELAHTSSEGWAETSLTDVEKLGPTEGEDRIGEVPVMVAVEGKDPSEVSVAAPVGGGKGLGARKPRLGQRPNVCSTPGQSRL